MNLRTGMGVSLLLLATGISFWLLGEVQTRPAPSVHSVTTPRYFLTGATLVHWNQPGAPVYRVTAERLERIGHPGFFVLTQPRFETRTKDATLWTVRSQHGILYSRTHILKLWQGVLARGSRPTLSFPLTVAAPRLRIALITERATTSALTTLHYGPSWITGVGFMLDLHTDTLTLHSKVHGRLLPLRPGAVP